jgi:hypothetical protein
MQAAAFASRCLVFRRFNYTPTKVFEDEIRDHLGARFALPTCATCME